MRLEISMTTLCAARVLGQSGPSAGGQILAMRFDRAGKRLAALSNDHHVAWFDLDRGRLIERQLVPDLRALVAFSDGLIAAGTRGLVRLDAEAEPSVSWERDDAAESWLVDAFGSDDGKVVAIVEELRESYQPAGHRIRILLDDEVLHVLDVDASLVPDLVPSAITTAFSLNAVALSGDGTTLVALATLSRIEELSESSIRHVPITGVLFAWNARTGERIMAKAVDASKIFLGNDSSYHHAQRIALSPDGVLLAVGWGAPRLFDVKSGALVTTLEVPSMPRGESAASWCVAFTPGGEKLIGAGDTELYVFDVKSRSFERAQPYPERAFVLGLTASAGLAIVANDTSLLAFSLPELERRFESDGHARQITALAVSDDGRVVSSDGTFAMGWNAAGQRTFKRSSLAYCGVSMSPDGEQVLLPLSHTEAAVLETASGRVLSTAERVGNATAWTVDDRIVHVSYDEVIRDERICADIIVSEGPDAREVARLGSPYLRCIPSLSGDGRRALVHDEYTLHCWDLERQACSWSRSLEVTAVALSSDGGFVAALLIADGALHLLDGATGAELGEIDLGLEGFAQGGLAWAGGCIVLGADSNDAVVVEVDLDALAAGRLRSRAARLSTGNQGATTAVAVASNARFAATGGRDGRVALFDLGAGLPLADWCEHVPAATEPIGVGDRVVVTEGAFRKLGGIVTAIAADGQLSLELEAFGRKLPVQLRRDDVEKA